MTLLEKQMQRAKDLDFRYLARWRGQRKAHFEAARGRKGPRQASNSGYTFENSSLKYSLVSNKQVESIKLSNYF